MNEGTAIRVLSFLNESNQQHLETLASEKRKVTVIGEEHEPEQTVESDDENELNDGSKAFLTSEKIKEFFDAVEEGSIEELEELFNSRLKIDPNMTRYTESLLMAAIRAKRYKIAEYLIDRLGIDVNHTTELLEFRPQTRMPIRHQPLSCRELAYDRGMMDLVDLIDIASDDVKPNIKRFLQKRIKHRLDEIHQAYLKRAKERPNLQIVSVEDKEIKMIEESNEDRDSDESIPTKVAEEAAISSRRPSISQPAHQASSAPATAKPYTSHIEQTLQKLELSNEKSIDDTGKKVFRFSNYTVRFRLIETNAPPVKVSEAIPVKPRSRSLPHIIPNSARSATIPPTSAASAPRPLTGASLFNQPSRYSFSDVNTQAPVRETRTSICRSARCVSTPRVVSAVSAEPKPEPKPKSSRIPSQRLMPKRLQSIQTNAGYVAHNQQPIFYNQANHYVPLTLRSTAIGLPLTTHRLIRD